MTPQQIAQNIRHAGFDLYWGRLSPAEQRRLFGAAIFGTWIVDIRLLLGEQGRVTVTWSSDGFDKVHTALSFERIAEHVSWLTATALNPASAA